MNNEIELFLLSLNPDHDKDKKILLAMKFVTESLKKLNDMNRNQFVTNESLIVQLNSLSNKINVVIDNMVTWQEKMNDVLYRLDKNESDIRQITNTLKNKGIL